MKTCAKCSAEKEDDAFSWKEKANGRRSTVCKCCHNIYTKKHYKNNKKNYIDRAIAFNKEAATRNKEYVYQYLLCHACVDCGESNPVVLDFDHISSDKCWNIGNMVNSGRSTTAIQKEIDKCEVVCSNCHRIRTAKRINSYRYKRSMGA